MSKRKLQQLMFAGAPECVTSVPSPKALERWTADLAPATAAASGENVIEILDVIGEDFWTGGGVTAKRVQAQLKTMKGDIRVLMNSPGGLVDEGNAIYNMFRAHDGKITVQILGMAASIASIIAMAADEIQIAKSGFMMLHNCSTIAFGTRHELQAAIEWASMVDETMREIYVDRSGMADAELAQMMDRETYMRGETAIAKGLADKLLPADAINATAQRAVPAAQPAVHRLDAMMARGGMPRAERRRFLADLKSGMQNAAEGTTQNAGARAEIDGELERLASIRIV